MDRAAGEHFDAIANEYDAIALRAHPCYEEMLDQVIAALPEAAGGILELGCGTGALTARLARRYPQAHLAAVDSAPRMIELAGRRLEEQGSSPHERIVFIAESFEALQLPDDTYDLVASNMALHHVIDKTPLYARVRRALRRGGLFVFGDELTAMLPHIEERHWNGWLEFARRPGHLSEEQVDDLVRHCRELDHYETLPRQLELLRAAGFDPVDCVWRYLNYAVFVAQG